MAKLSTKQITGVVFFIVAIIVLFKVMATIIPEAQTASDELGDSDLCIAAGGNYNASGPTASIDCYNETPQDVNSSAVAYTAIPLSALFSSSGVI